MQYANYNPVVIPLNWCTTHRSMFFILFQITYFVSGIITATDWKSNLSNFSVHFIFSDYIIIAKKSWQSPSAHTLPVAEATRLSKTTSINAWTQISAQIVGTDWQGNDTNHSSVTGLFSLKVINKVYNTNKLLLHPLLYGTQSNHL